MTIESLKTKLDKREAEAKQLKKELKEAELAEQREKANLAKLEAKKDEIKDAVEAVLSQAGVSLPEGKFITITVSESGVIVDVSDVKVARKGGGNGGAKSIVFEGQQISWAALCELKNIARTPGGSAHRDVFNKAKDLHDSIEHDCTIDDKVYPTS